MDLVRAILTVVRTLPAELSAADLGQIVRTLLIGVAGGDRVPGLDGAEEAAVRAWLAKETRKSGDLPASLHEQMLGLVIERSGENVTVRREARRHRATGAYYTGSQVAEYMVRRVREFAPQATSLVDPACGSGAFLSVAHDRLSEDVQLYGLDTDPTALGLCREAVPSADLRLADALLDDLAGGFDVCLGNPPYISSGLRGAASHDDEWLQRLRFRYPSSAEYKINTYPLFVERGLQLVKPGGLVGYILPDSFLTGRYFTALRRLLLANTPLELTLIRQDFWRHGRVGQSVVLFVRKGPAPAGHLVDVKVAEKIEQLSSCHPVALPLSEIAWGGFQRFRLVLDGPLRKRLRQMETIPRGRLLGNDLRTYSGLIGRRGQTTLLRSSYADNESSWGRLLRSGREIDRYWLEWAGEEACLRPELIKSGGQFDFYRRPKLLLRQTADSLRAVYDEAGYYCLNNIHLLCPRREDVNLRVLLGFINSGRVNEYYKAVTMEAGRLYAQVDLDIVQELPIPPIDITSNTELLELVQMREKAAPAGAAQLDLGIDGIVATLYGLV